MSKSSRKIKWISLALLVAMLIGMIPASAITAYAEAEQTKIVSLKTSGQENPLGIDDENPTFSWQMESNIIGAEQKAYRIVVTKDSDGSTVWDSGKVESGVSTYINYGGSALEAATAYTWTVTVTDQSGNEITSEPAHFETALMSTSLSAWDGAEWIGADELTLDATSAAYFDLSMDVQIPAGSTKASIIFGANDYRLSESTYSVWRTATENNYFKYEIDITDPDNAKLNIYVVGMPIKGQDIENDPDEADATINISSDIINSANAHEKMTVRITTTTSNVNQVTCIINGTYVDSNRQLNTLGNSHNNNTFPNLNSIGFAVPEGEVAYYRNITIENPGKYSSGTLFAQDIGATYDIFKDLSDSINVDDSTGIITVDGTSGEVLEYADPSYGSAPMLRTEFATGKTIDSARLYITAQGIYNAYINGESISDDYFNPGNNEYRESIAYQTYDITDMLNSGGNNAIGVQLSEGWWSGYQTYTLSNYNYYGDKQAALAKIVVNYTDGTSETIVSDADTWDYYGDGPVEYGSFYQGERYNALKETAVEGWSEAGYDATNWHSATEITAKAAFSNYELITRNDEPIHVVDELTATSLGESREGSGIYIYDMGENVTGVSEITIPAQYVDEGSEVIIRYAEILYPELEEYEEQDLDGLLMVENLRAALATDFYTAKAGDQVYSQQYTYHGYRYIEISGLKSELPAENVKTLVLSSIDTTATYDSSNDLVNRFFKNVQNSQTSNYLSVPLDCPQRNERMGWTGDAQAFSTAATYNAEVYNFYQQWLQTLRAQQGENGAIPVTAPSYGTVNDDGSVTLSSSSRGISWDAALTIIPYNMYQQYGGTEIIEENIDAIYKYLNFLDNNDMTIGDATIPELTSQTGSLADWLPRVSTNAALINNAVYVYLLGIASEMAEIMDRIDMADELQDKYVAAKEKWNELYVDPDTGQTRYPSSYDSSTGEYTYVSQNTQASYATPLRYGVFSDEYEEKAAENYALTVTNPDEYTDSNGTVQAYTITSGFSGTPNLVPVLTDYGYVEEAYALFEATDYASWLYPVTQGATSVWERWNSYTTTNGFGGNNGMNSFNHFALGAVSEWMMSYQLGITTSEDGVGYKNYVLQPTVGGSFTYANGSFESGYGTISSGWKATGTGSAEGDGVGATSYNEITSYTTTVPANTTATLYLPVTTVNEVTLPEAGIKYVGITTNNGIDVAEFELTAGGYEFDIDDNGNITAKIADGFVVLDETTYVITGSANAGGTVTESTEARVGTDASITVKADDGYKLVAILIDGVTVDISGISNDTYILQDVQSDVTLRALFVEDGVDFAERYNDVLKKTEDGEDTWYYEEVDMLTGLELVDGTSENTFEPESNVKRSEFTKMLYELAVALGMDVETSSSIPFTDMPVEDYWAIGYIGWAYENEIVDGYDGIKFGPEDTITREDMAVMLRRFFEVFAQYDLPGERTINFTDASEISGYASSAVDYVVQKELMQGDDELFRPLDSSRRNEAAQILYNYLIYAS